MATSAVAVHPTSRLPHAPRPLVLGGIALAGVALAVVELALAIPHDGNDIQIALLLWITLPYIAAGLIAWWRRPDSRLGPLMVAGGFAIGISSLQLADDLTITTIGALFDILPVAIFLHVYLAFPDGRLRSRIERWLVVAAYAIAIGLQLVKMMLGSFPNHLQVTSQPDAASVVEKVQLLSLSAICLVAIGVLLARRRQVGRPRRRMLALVQEKGARGVADDMLPKLLGRSAQSNPAIVDRTRSLIEANAPDTITGAIRALMSRPDSTPMLSSIHCPTLIIVGEEDAITPPKLSEEMHRAIRGSELVVIQQAGHLSNLEQPDTFNAAMVRFLEHRV